MRFFKIVRILMEYFVFYRLNSHKNKFFGLRMREACEELGPMFVKFGQLLSMRYDVLEEKDAGELQKLLDSAKPFSYKFTREIIRKDFGKYPEELFQRFDEKPVASASVAQVYRAWLNDGTKVAVKVRRPFIGKLVERDIRIIKGIAKFAQAFSPTLRKIRAVNIVDEMNKALKNEIDFLNEVDNMKKMKDFSGHYSYRKVRSDLGHIFIPDVYDFLCSRNVLTMEFLEGIPMTNFRDVLDDPDYDVKKSIKTLISGSIRGTFDDKKYIFHADPHPANLILMKNGDVGLLDFGIIGEFTQKQNRKSGDLFLAVYTKNLDSAVDSALKLIGVEIGNRKKKIFRQDIKKYLERTEFEGIGYWFLGMTKIFIKNKLGFPIHLTLMGRSNVIFDGLIHSVDPESTTLDYVGEELRKGVLKKLARNIIKTDYLSVLYNLSERFKESPEKLNHFVNRYYDNPMALVRDIKKEFFR